MAQQSNNRRPQNRPNWFQKQRNAYGAQFLTQIRLDTLQRDVIHMFRDLGRGNYNPMTDAECFLNSQFLETCLYSAMAKIQYHGLIVEALTAFIQAGNHRESQDSILTIHQRSLQAYTIIYTNLESVRMTGDVQYISVMVSQLIKDRYGYNI